MKRLVGLLLALVLVCTLAVPALASEMYDAYGPMEEWSEETWVECEGWTDEQWDDYYQGENEAWEQRYEKRRIEEKQALGYPNPHGYNVKLDEKFLVFPNQQPLLLEEEAYLPFRDFFTLLGAQIGYDNDLDAATATFADGRVLSIALGASTMMLQTAEGDIESIELYTPAQLIEGSLYVPLYYVCSGLGYDVFEDYSYDAAFLVDRQALIAELDARFTLANRYLHSAFEQEPDLETIYQVQGRYLLEAMLYGEEQNDTASAVINFDGVTQGLNTAVNMDFALDLEQMEDSIFSSLDEETWQMLRGIDGGKLNMILNFDTQKFYLQTSLAALIPQLSVLREDAWLQFDLAEIGLEGLTANDLLSMITSMVGEISVGAMIYESASPYYYASNPDVWGDARAAADMVALFVGDQYFTSKESGNTVTHTLKLDEKAFSAAIAATTDDSYYTPEWISQISASHQLVLQESDGVFNDIRIDSSLHLPMAVPLTFSLKVEENATHTLFDCTVSGRYGGKLHLLMEAEMKEISTPPAAAPPDGSRILEEDYFDSDLLWDLYWNLI